MKTITKYLPFILLAITITVLSYAFLRAGIYYILDNDELSHVQKAYLINSGYLPYRDFFSIYPPIFHWMLALILKFTGASADAFAPIRFIMAGLFLVRLTFLFAIIRKIKGPVTAATAVIIYLIDPFNSFTAIQIRPDNLMLTFYLGSLVALLALTGKNRKTALVLHVTLLTLSVLTLPKIVPTAAITAIGVIAYLYFKKQFSLIPVYPLIIASVSAIIIIPFAAENALPQMVKNTFFDPPKTNETLLYPTRLGAIYVDRTNYWLFGHESNPENWRFVWILPLLSFFGVGTAITKILDKKTKNISDYLTVTLALSLTVQFIAMLYINSIFIQYYIPVLWLYAGFSAMGIAYTWQYLKTNRSIATVCGLILIIYFGMVGQSAYTGNLNRALIKDNTLSDIRKMNMMISPDQKTFPNAMFRPFSYPMPYGYFYGDIPEEIKKRYGPIRFYLERDRVQYLFVNDYLMNFFDQQDQAYINANYVTSQDGIWRRKGN